MKREGKKPGRRIWYTKGARAAGCILQGLLAALTVLCLLGVWLWTEGNFSLSEMGRSFESTGVFLRTVDSIILKKINSDQDRELFEDAGAYNPDKLIDIRQYASGVLDQSSQNLNTSYRISDLISFAGEGAQAMQERIGQLSDSPRTQEEIGEALSQEASTLETILPASGTLLADYSKVSANASLAVVEYYRNLCETALDVAERYEEYTASETQEDSEEAPSNVLYYVENTATKQRYSNLEAGTLTEARSLVKDMSEMTFLFEGERRFNIMVVNSANVLNDQVSQWFSRMTMVGSNEKILIAVDLTFPIGDSLQTAYLDYQHRLPLMKLGLIVGSLSVVLLLILLVLSVCVTGRAEKGGEVYLGGFDRLPTEIAAGLCLILAISWWVLTWRAPFDPGSWQGREILLLPAAFAVEYWILLFSLLSLVRRVKAGTLWHNSVAYYVVWGSRQVISARRSSQRLMIGYIGFIVLNLVFLMIGGLPGTIMMLALNLAALLYLLRDSVGNQNIREGLKQISTGKLDYRINEEVLTGESREMGRAVNEMGVGLQRAVDSMLQGERLKAELITNVSHDLKTPLTSIINYVDLLKREPAGSPRSAEYLRILEQKTQRLKSLTEDLIEVSKISSGNIELHPMRLMLQQFVMQAAGEFEEKLKEREIGLHLELPKEPIYIRADGEQLWRVFENLLGNAVKYARQKTPLTIALAVDPEGFALVSFHNQSAVKITATAQELLERFSRGDASRTTEGSGLGLSIAQSLTRLMGGDFLLEVEEEDFRAVLRFPIFDPKA